VKHAKDVGAPLQIVQATSATSQLNSKGAQPQTMDIAEMAIQVGGAREGQSFVLKI
jgi:hypothetical protein